jgi:hypothetical protein
MTEHQRWLRHQRTLPPWRRSDLHSHVWQAFGRYTDVPADAPFAHSIRPDEEPIFASPVRASNAYMAAWRVLRQVYPYGPVIDSLRRTA